MAYIDTLAKLQKEIQTELPAKLTFHIYRVAQIALYLGRHHSELDQRLLWIASLAHDRFRHLPYEEQRKIVNDWGIEVDPEIPDYALHGHLAAYHLKTNYNIDEPHLIEMIENHTLLGPKFSKLSALFFMSDKMDFLKPHYNGINTLREFKEENFWHDCLKIAELHADRTGHPHKILLHAINQLKEICAQTKRP